jgi:hypothetical protein
VADELRAPFPYFGDAMAYAKAHVAAGVLRVDADGTIWRCMQRTSDGWQNVMPRRVENVGGKGYLRVSLHVSKGHGLAIVMAHRLVYELLVGPIPAGLEIDHKDNNKTNNRPENLQTVTGLENMKLSNHRGRTKPWAIARSSPGATWRGKPLISEEQKTRARQMRLDGATLKHIAETFGIAVSHAQRITTGESR